MSTTVTDVRLDSRQLMAILALLAPEPCQEDVNREMQNDRLANSYNDSHKLRRRTESEIRCQLRLQYANMMLNLMPPAKAYGIT